MLEVIVKNPSVVSGDFTFDVNGSISAIMGHALVGSDSTTDAKATSALSAATSALDLANAASISATSAMTVANSANTNATSALSEIASLSSTVSSTYIEKPEGTTESYSGFDGTKWGKVSSSTYSAGFGLSADGNTFGVDTTKILTSADKEEAYTLEGDDYIDIVDNETAKTTTIGLKEEPINLIAGANITLTSGTSGLTIAATGGGSTYTAGDNIDITNSKISVTADYNFADSDTVKLVTDDTNKTISFSAAAGGGSSTTIVGENGISANTVNNTTYVGISANYMLATEELTAVSTVTAAPTTVEDKTLYLLID